MLESSAAPLSEPRILPESPSTGSPIVIIHCVQTLPSIVSVQSREWWPTCSTLSEHIIVRPEQLSERSRTHRIHGSGFEVHQNCSRYIFATCNTITTTVTTWHTRRHVRPGPLGLFCGAGNFGKIWSACRQDVVQYTEWRMKQYTIITFKPIPLPAGFVYTSRAIIYTLIIIIGKMFKNKIHSIV
jgi:hypothetical protein